MLSQLLSSLRSLYRPGTPQNPFLLIKRALHGKLQGETDALSIPGANTYYTKLENYVLSMRSAFKMYNPMLPIITGIMATQV